jgi:hypothetical protein
MEVQQFQDSRNAKLNEFKKQYAFLRSQYSSTLLAAIQEKDSQKQQSMISQVLEINSEMISQLRDILSQLNKGTDTFQPKTLDELTKDLIQYQKDYSEIEKAKDKVQTLKMIHLSGTTQLESATTMYYMYVGALLLLCFIVGFLVLRTSWVTTLFSGVSQMFTPNTIQT